MLSVCRLFCAKWHAVLVWRSVHSCTTQKQTHRYTDNDTQRCHFSVKHALAFAKRIAGWCTSFRKRRAISESSDIPERKFLYSDSDWFTLCALFIPKLCSNAPFCWMISDNYVNSSHLEIVTFVLVCDTWGSARATESKPLVKMGHFRVISQSRIDQYVNHLQNLLCFSRVHS